MTKVKLNLEPTDQVTFSRKVSIPTPDGKPLNITFEFRYRDRLEMAEMMERYATMAREQQESAKTRAAGAMPDAAEVEQIVLASIERDVDVVMDAATNWDADPPFSRETLRKFFRRYPGAAPTIAADYRVSLIEGRLGN